MRVIKSVNEIKETIHDTHKSPVSLVPTMGALHNGHLSLVNDAIKKCPLTVVSIYVNPTQFNDKEDLKNYPRTIEADLELLSRVLRPDDIVFTPDDKEMYPVVDTRIFHFGNIENVMEAVRRPGHFNGVAQIVSRLFEIIEPDFSFFGLKDFQQLAVIKALVRQTGVKVTIIGNPIIREPDGLAMSSRNRLLEPEIRKKAPVIYKTISAASLMLPAYNISEIKKFVKDNVEKEGLVLEYFEIVDDIDLVPVTSKDGMSKENHYFGCVAVKAGKIRLIDNVEFRLL